MSATNLRRAVESVLMMLAANSVGRHAIGPAVASVYADVFPDSLTPRQTTEAAGKLLLGHAMLTANLLLRLHELTGEPVDELLREAAER